MPLVSACAGLIVLVAVAPTLAAAQTVATTADAATPPAPIVSRDAVGRITVRAVRATTPMRIDGRLDEAIYTAIAAISDYVQQEPDETRPATEKTGSWASSTPTTTTPRRGPGSRRCATVRSSSR